MSQTPEELRKELKDGRTAKSRANSGTAAPNGGGDDISQRAALQDARRSITTVESQYHGYEERDPQRNGGTAPGERTTGHDKPGPKSIFKRHGQTSRRPGENSGSASASAETTESEQPGPTSTRQIGNLVADGPVPARLPDAPEPEKKKRDRRGYVQPSRLAARAAREAGKIEGAEISSKPAGGNKIPFMPQGRKLSVTEVETIKGPFADSLEAYFRYMDQFLWTRQEKAGKPTGEQPVWSNLDEEEIAALTRVMMRFGQHNEAAAATVRGVVEGRDYIDVGMIFVPRVQATVQIMRETAQPKQSRRKSA